MRCPRTAALSPAQRTRARAEGVAARLGHAGDRQAEQAIKDLIRSHDSQRSALTALTSAYRAALAKAAS